ncbi:reverse transcriptase zinc-binding domain-containing protein, partial [Tanacetum coccineum]
MEDKLMWCSKDGSIKNFSSSQVWNDIRCLNDKMTWWKVIWFPQNVPRQAFVLWMASKGKLVTQDKLAQWYPNKSWKCPLCLKVEDSHKHLFFECDYSKVVWVEMQNKMNVRNLTNLNECLHKFASLPCKNSIWSIVRRLCIADIVYHLWLERNTRIFHQRNMSSSSLLHIIINSVKSRLLTLKVKHTTAVRDVESKWVSAKPLQLLSWLKVSCSELLPSVMVCWIWPGYLVAVFKRLAEGLIAPLIVIRKVSCFDGVPTGDALIAGPKFFLMGFYAKILKLYHAYELCNKNEQLHVFDSEDTLEDAEKSRLKMNEFQKDEKVQELKIKPIDYGKLNKLYDDFVPQKELSAEQTYFPSSFISSKEFSSKTKPSMASMPSANPMLVDLNEMENIFKTLFELIQKNCKRASTFYTSPEEIQLND